MRRTRVVNGAAGPTAAFTLLELLLAITLLSAVSVITFMTFAVVTTAWKKGMALSDDLSHGDFVLEQLVGGLRSTYYPSSGKYMDYGFILEDDGDGEYVRDSISWVKTGTALVGENCPFSENLHRVKITLEEDDLGRPAIAVRAWRVQRQLDDFDPDDVEPIYISSRVVGFNCRPAFETEEDEMGEESIEWLDEWEDTNSIPSMVELTLYLDPIEEGGDPVEVKRCVGIEVASLSKPKTRGKDPAGGVGTPASGSNVSQPGGSRTRRSPRMNPGSGNRQPTRNPGSGSRQRTRNPGSRSRQPTRNPGTGIQPVK